MKQLLQNLKNGELQLAPLPVSSPSNSYILIQTEESLISIGTEKMLMEFSNSNYLEKALKQPDKVKEVLSKISTDGLSTTISSVVNKLDELLPIGYSNVGRVIEVGENVSNFKVGDRVVSNGAHAEIVCCPKNLCAHIPDNVSNTEASFTVTASIGLQGVRLLDPQLGDTVVVTGLGLIGLLTVQLLQANGCKVIGLDYDKSKLALAKSWGIETIDLNEVTDPQLITNKLTKGNGVDGVIITASTTSSKPLNQAANMCRKRGKIVLVGVVGSKWSRNDFYQKELSFQVSCSYGPGRYDKNYEENGQDYPLGFVRWTEQRNFEAILELFSQKKISVEDMITEKIAFEDSVKEYKTILQNPSIIGATLIYSSKIETERKVSFQHSKHTPPKNQLLSASFIGAGNYTKCTLLPAFDKTKFAKKVSLNTIVSRTGISSNQLAKKHRFKYSSTDMYKCIESKENNIIFITTQHNTHFSLVVSALKLNKHVFVEKPLCLSLEELNEIQHVYNNHKGTLMVGFNRRFSPFIQKIKTLLKSHVGPKTAIFTINAGAIPPDHWTQSKDKGGGRIIGEAVHFIDLAKYILNDEIYAVRTFSTDDSPQLYDNVTIQLIFQNGNQATIHYLSTGHKSYPKENIKIFSQGTIIELDNFKRLTTTGFSFFKNKKGSQNKGHVVELEEYFSSIESGNPLPISVSDIFESTKASILADISAKDKSEKILSDY